MRLFKEFLVIFVSPVLAIAIVLASVFIYVNSVSAIQPTSADQVAAVDTSATLASSTDIVALPATNDQSPASTTSPIVPLAISTPVPEKSEKKGVSKPPAKPTASVQVASAAPIKTSVASSSPVVSTPPPPPPPVPVLSASANQVNGGTSGEFAISATPATSGDALSLSFSCPADVTATLTTNSVDLCNQSLALPNGRQSSVDVIFSNSAANQMPLPITILESNAQGAIATTTRISLELSPGAFSAANYKTFAFTDISGSYVADGSVQHITWKGAGYDDTDFGVLTIQNASGIAIPAFAGSGSSFYIPSLSDQSVSFSFSQGLSPGKYQFIVTDNNGNQIAKSPFFSIIASSGQTTDSNPVTANLSINGSGGSLTVPAGSTEVLDWTSNGQLCTTATNNTADASWANTATVPPQGSHVIPALTAGGLYTYYLTCQDSALKSASTQLTLTVQ